MRGKEGLFGLKQSPTLSFGELFESVFRFGLQRCLMCPLAFHIDTDGGNILLVVYVDDSVIIRNDLQKQSWLC